VHPVSTQPPPPPHTPHTYQQTCRHFTRFFFTYLLPSPISHILLALFKLVGFLCPSKVPFSLITPLGYIVILFVRYVCCDFSKTASPIFAKFGEDVQHRLHISLLTAERSRGQGQSVQDQNRRTENVPVAITRPRLRYLHQIWKSDRYWASRSNFGVNGEIQLWTKFKMAARRKFAFSWVPSVFHSFRLYSLSAEPELSQLTVTQLFVEPYKTHYK